MMTFCSFKDDMNNVEGMIGVAATDVKINWVPVTSFMVDTPVNSRSTPN
jgi:hypothetical protein